MSEMSCRDVSGRGRQIGMYEVSSGDEIRYGSDVLHGLRRRNVFLGRHGRMSEVSSGDVSGRDERERMQAVFCGLLSERIREIVL